MPGKIDILGIKVDNLDVEELKEDVINFANCNVSKTIMYVNANGINLSQKDAGFRTILNSADILHPDGWGVVWASGFLGASLREKIVVTDFFVDFCKELAKRKISIYFLGGKPGFAKKAKEKLQQKIPALNIVGVSDGYFDDNKEIVNEINNSKPDILTVGMGTPKQEIWIYNNRHLLNVPLYWSVGGLFDFFSGEVKRAPKWIQNFNLEWAYRLCQEPDRLWKRYLIGNVMFIWNVLKFKLINE